MTPEKDTRENTTHVTLHPQLLDVLMCLLKKNLELRFISRFIYMFTHVSVTHGVIISKERRALLVSYFMFLFWHHQFSTLAISRHYRRWLPQITLFIFGVIITRYFYSEYEFQQKLTATISHRQDLNFDENMGGIAWWAFGVNFFVTSSSSRKITLECLLPDLFAKSCLFGIALLFIAIIIMLLTII